jgi:osmotically-inducible protein OsmY
MMRHFTSHIALASQLFAASAGLYLLGSPLANADSTAPVPVLHRVSKADRDLTQKIRRAVVTDKSLSMAAHNVQITAVDGAVTLTGPVKSEDEKKAVEGKAAGIAGAGKVTDQLTVPK